MPTRNISFSQEHDALIERHLAAGTFRDASDVIGMALTAFDQDGMSDDAKLRRLRQLVAEGFDALDRGEYVVIPPDEIGTYFQRRAEQMIRDKGR